MLLNNSNNPNLTQVVKERVGRNFYFSQSRVYDFQYGFAMSSKAVRAAEVPFFIKRKTEFFCFTVVRFISNGYKNSITLNVL